MAMSQAMSVLTSRKTVQWYTPPPTVGLVRAVLGQIDLDPASSAMPQQWIQASKIYTAEDNGLMQRWYGRVFLNPPFDDTAKWIKKLIAEYQAGNVKEAIALVNSNLGYSWYENLWRKYPVCCARERIRFIAEDGTHGGQAKRGQTFVYFGHHVFQFNSVFKDVGRVILPLAL